MIVELWTAQQDVRKVHRRPGQGCSVNGDGFAGFGLP
jgi:hypothetical protein